MRLLLVIFLLVCQNSQAQIVENFSNYETADLPKYWLGDTQNFQINPENELQLNAPAAGQSMLVHRNFLPDSLDFEIWFRLDFAPSQQNQLRIYLQADTSNLLIANGYFIEIGESGSDDALRFFKQENGQATLLASGKTGEVGSDPVETTLKITRRKGGKWQCWLGDIASGTAVAQFSIVDNSFAGAKNLRFGILCKYTDTRRDAFYFQKINALQFKPDTEPPKLLKVEALADTLIQIDFSEALDSTFLQIGNVKMYPNASVSQTQFTPNSATSVLVSLSSKLQHGVDYQVFIKGVKDLEGNLAAGFYHEFKFIETLQPKNLYLTFSEIMADPSPSAGYPEVEWIEIFNATNFVVDLSGMTLTDASGQVAVFPPKKLKPKDLILVLPDGHPDFQPPAVEILPIQNFPNLNNDHDLLILKNKAGEVVDAVEYFSTWHTDPAKSGGGYSLERRNPNMPCAGGENWGTSKALSGGTPGSKNSIYSNFKDELPPRLLVAFPLSETKILLQFSEGLDATAAQNLLNFKIVPTRKIEEIEFSEINRTEMILHLAEPLDSSRIYDLQIENTLTDCVGNPIFYPDDVDIALPKTPENQDIIINELLFDPASGGSRFVEILNRSNKYLSLEDLYVADFSGSGGTVKIGRQRLFSPDEIFVLATDTTDIFQNFKNVKRENLIKINLPNFDTEAGNCSIFFSKNGQSVVLDSFNFSKNMHNALLPTDEQEGTSLERIRADAPTNFASNWTSAASQDTFDRGTPTQQNSQSRSGQTLQQEEFISLVSNRLSPDGDGRDDFLEIQFDLPSDGFVATFSIFDSDGRLVKKLVRQDLLGTAGTLRWDGDSDEGSERVRPGIHVLFAEIFHPDGSVRREKLVFSVIF